MTDATAEVRSVVEAFADCWNRHDIGAFAQLFAEDAEFVNVVGAWWRGRAEIQAAHEVTHRTLFQHSRLTVAEVAVRFPVRGLAIARCRWTLVGHVTPTGAPLPERRGVLLTVMRQDGARWGIIDAQNTDVVEGALSRPQ